MRDHTERPISTGAPKTNDLALVELDTFWNLWQAPHDWKRISTGGVQRPRRDRKPAASVL